MPVLQRYRYFQPMDGRFRYRDAGPEAGGTALSLVYSGMIPTGEEETAEEVLERLVLRHASDLRPHSRDLRPLGAGDVLDLAGRGIWQVLPIGFRELHTGDPALVALN